MKLQLPPSARSEDDGISVDRAVRRDQRREDDDENQHRAQIRARASRATIQESPISRAASAQPLER